MARQARWAGWCTAGRQRCSRTESAADLIPGADEPGGTSLGYAASARAANVAASVDGEDVVEKVVESVPKQPRWTMVRVRVRTSCLTGQSSGVWTLEGVGDCKYDTDSAGRAAADVLQCIECGAKVGRSSRKGFAWLFIYTNSAQEEVRGRRTAVPSPSTKPGYLRANRCNTNTDIRILAISASGLVVLPEMMNQVDSMA